MTSDAGSGVAAEASPADQMCERLFGSAIGFTEVLGTYLGDRLGLYRALRELGAATCGELAQQAGVAERYAREWLEQEATAGVLAVAEASRDGNARRYRIPEGCDGALTDPDDLANILPLARALVAIARMSDSIVEAFRSGGGVPYASYGTELAEAQAALNRPIYRHLLAGWLGSMPKVHSRLSSERPARVADVACGGAWSSIAMARAYPNIMVDGFDLDQTSVDLATRNVREAGLEGRVRVSVLGAASIPAAGEYDLVTIFEAVHDMARPVEALRQVASLVRDGGAVIVMEENTGEDFEAPGGIDAFLYGASMTLCLPATLAEEGSVGTGAVIRRSTLEEYASAAGFSSVQVLPIEHPFFRLYELQK